MQDATSDATQGPYTIKMENHDAASFGDTTITVDPEQMGSTTIPMITSPIRVGKVKHRPDKAKAKRRRKLSKASRQRNRK